MIIRRRTALSALALPALIGHAQAEAFPDQPVRLIIPFAAGGPADLIARTIGRVMGEKLGKPVVVEARAGAAGLIGVDYVAKARPDGYTIVLASSGAMAVLPHLQPNMPFDPRTDLSPISQVIAVPQIVSIAPGLGPRNLAELVAMAKARPGQLAYGSAGIGSSLHLAGELFKLRAGIDMVHVPFRGAAPAVTELLAGRIQVLLADVPALLGHVRSGALPALAITSQERLSILPNVPTAEEAGVPGLVSETWYGVLGPAGLPADRVTILHGAVRAALDDPATREVLLNQGGRIVGSNPDAFATFIRSAYDQWGEVVRTTGMRLE